MEKDYLVLKGASASRPSGEWNDDDYDVLAERRRPHHEGRRIASHAVAMDFGVRASRRPHPHPRICRNPRGRHGSVREELAAEARSLGKIGHHDQDAPQRDQHSKPERGGPYYQTHVHYSM
jgi:hypothetical protein